MSREKTSANTLEAEIARNAITKAARRGVATHNGNDLDNRLSIYALIQAGFIPPDAYIKRIRFGQVLSEHLNVDVGAKECIEPITIDDKGTVIIDPHYSGMTNTLQILKERLGIEVPEAALAIANTPREKESPLVWNTGIAVARYANTEMLWYMASNGMLERELTTEEMESLGVLESALRQKAVIDHAVETVKGSVLNDRVIHITSFLKAGSAIAHALGYDIYISSQDHMKGGITFAIAARNGDILPESVLEWAQGLRDNYGSAVFIKPDRSCIVAGGRRFRGVSIGMTHHELRKQVLDAIESS